MGTRAVDAEGDRRPRKPRRFQIGVRGLIVAVACFGLIAWAGRSIREGRNPTLVAARGLRSSDPADRADAAFRLMAMPRRDPGLAIPPLIGALGDKMPAVRRASASALGNIAGEAARSGAAAEDVRAAVAGLIRTLRDPDPTVRLVAADALTTIASTQGSVDRRAIVDALAGLIGDGEDDVRLGVLTGLRRCGETGADRPPAALLAALEDRSPRIRAAAITALAGFRCPLDPWLPYLLRTLDQRDPVVAPVAWEAIGRANPPAFSPAAMPALAAALGGRSPAVRSRVVMALCYHAREPDIVAAIPALLSLLREPIGLERSRAGTEGWLAAIMACQVLGRVAPGTPKAEEVAGALAEVFRSGDPALREAAIAALADFGPEAEPAIPAMLRIWRADRTLKTKAPFAERQFVAWALGRIAPGTKSADEALSALIEVLDPGQEADIGTQLAVIEALPAFGARAARALPRLRGLRTDDDARLKEAVEASVAAIEGVGEEVSDGNTSR